MSMDDTLPPTPVPPAAQSPYPAHPEPRAHGEAPLPEAPKTSAGPGVAMGALGMTLVGGALAAAVGAMVVRPWLKRRNAKSAQKRAGSHKKPD